MRENGQGTGINANKIIIEIELFSEIQDWMLGVDVLVSAEQLVNSKVYLSTNSSSMNSAGLKQPNASVTVGNFDKSKSALILNTHDDDAHGGRVEGFFELSTGNGLKYGSNGEMEFYVYVENYSTTNSVYYRANINLKDGGTTPFTITENPKYVTSGTAGTGATVSLLVCKINSQETDLEVNNTTIGIDLFSGIQEWMRGVDVLVNLESAVKSKVYLSTNSSSMNSAGLKQPNASVTVGNFDKSKSALVSNSYDSDNHNGKVESYFELKTGEYGLEYDSNGNMEFYVYVENYSATESVYYRANINFVNGGASPFTVTSNPKYVTLGAGTTTSLLVFKIHSQETNLDVKKVTIEIELYTFGSVSTLELSSWSDINKISELGWASEFFNLGDEKTVLIGTVPYTFVILGFDHDDKSDGSGKAGITFGMKNLLDTTYKMNSKRTSSGGWNSSPMRTSTMAALLTQLPSDLQSAIKTVNKKATEVSQSTSILTSPDKLFLFSKVEIDGTADTGYKDEGNQYAYWVGKNAADRIKSLSNGSGSPYPWWLRSSHMIVNDSFRCFGYGGEFASSYANTTYGVCFGFCV